MKTKTLMRSLFPLAGLVMLVGASSTQAAMVSINVGSGFGTLSWDDTTGTVMGFTGAAPGVLSTANADLYDLDVLAPPPPNGTSEKREALALNALAGTTFTTGSWKEDNGNSPFTISHEYFTLKFGNNDGLDHAFFQITSGGPITFTYAKGANGLGLSHKTTFGNPVPLPAAAYLFGSALLGMAGIGYRRNKKQA
jgi:hypothetical protein